jgi:hypothetical protein
VGQRVPRASRPLRDRLIRGLPPRSLGPGGDQRDVGNARLEERRAVEILQLADRRTEFVEADHDAVRDLAATQATADNVIYRLLDRRLEYVK